MTEVTDIQVLLDEMGYDPGPIDGEIGPQTLSAMEKALDDLSRCVSFAPAPVPDQASTIPSEWMPDCDMSKIIVHWTAGGPKASVTDMEHYHILIEDDGKLIRGEHPITDNVSTSDDDYAAHTKNCNTGAIGVSLCGMAHAVQNPFNSGPYPLTEKQWDTLIDVLIDLCDTYNIAVSPVTVLTHAEVQANLGIQQEGKWDIAILPFAPEYNTAGKVGDLMRQLTNEQLGE